MNPRLLEEYTIRVDMNESLCPSEMRKGLTGSSVGKDFRTPV